MTKRRRRDKESVAKSHRNEIIGAESLQSTEHVLGVACTAAVVVNLARRCLAKQSLATAKDFWIRPAFRWLSGDDRDPNFISAKTVIHALLCLW